MNRTPRPYRVYFYAWFAVVCLVGLMQISTINSSSRTLSPGGRKVSEASHRSLAIGASYQSEDRKSVV